MIPYARQAISQADIDAVVEVLRSDFLTQGPMIERFERSVVDYCGAAHAVAVNSGTSALHIACQALGLGPGDRLWTSPNTFVASANCALYCGAHVDFVDIDPRTYNLSVEALAIKLERAAKLKALPKVIVPVHFAGQPCEMREIRTLAERYGFSVIEDASHAIGAQYRGEPVGNCRHSDITVFSFHPVKIVTTGEGGMALTNRSDLAERLRMLRTHGITRNPARMSREPDGPWYYEQTDLGCNYRMTDFQAALGASQMRKLESFVGRRRELALRYTELLEGMPLTLPWQHPDAKSAWHLYAIRLHLEKIGKNRRQVFEAMQAAGIGVNVHYIPVHTQPYYRELGFRKKTFLEAERYYEETITLPLFPSMSDIEQETVVSALRDAVR
ncbi:MAG: UDP-4-amino-4,6-dideoxy-N-acetyl-beta-L-altrosamine transaminase [Candidatus Competibacter sp.]|nr:UDP-4-amino-4,6-dideoxy-N-acetyl-beta-L-altrosamine transaminase [Candidatus Competibacter sp.]